MADKFTITVNGKEQEVKMTFGMLNAVCKTLEDVDRASRLTLDVEIMNEVMITLLSPRDSKGKITEELDINTLDVDDSEVMDLLAWAGNHALDFFLKGLERAKGLQDQHMPRVKALTPSLSGS